MDDNEFRDGCDFMRNMAEALLNKAAGKQLDTMIKEDKSGMMLLFTMLLRKYHMSDSDIFSFLMELSNGFEALDIKKPDNQFSEWLKKEHEND